MFSNGNEFGNVEIELCDVNSVYTFDVETQPYVSDVISPQEKKVQKFW